MPFDLPFDYLLGMAAWMLALGMGLPLLLVFRRRLGKSRTRWANLGLSLWFFLAALTAVELGFAVFYDQSDSFNSTNVSRHWFARHVEPMQKVLEFRDGQGTVYRDAHEFPKSLAADQHAICFIGDSFTYGHGVPDVVDRFSDRVAASLERKAPGRFVVSNLADAGRDLHWAEQLLKELAANHFPIQTVVYVVCLNDIETFDERTATMFQKPPAWLSQQFFIRDTYFPNLLYHRLQLAFSKDSGSYYSMLVESYSGPAWTRMRAKFEDIRRLCAANRYDLRIVIFPFLHDLGPGYPFAAAHQQISDYCRELKLPVLDLQPILEPHVAEGLTVNRFDAHPNARAHELAAEAIERDLLGDLLDRPTVRDEPPAAP